MKLFHMTHAGWHAVCITACCKLMKSKYCLVRMWSTFCKGHSLVRQNKWLLFLCPWLRRWHRHGARSIVGEETHSQVCSSDTRSTLNTLCVLKSKFWPKEEWKSTLVTFSSSAHTSERREPGHHVAPNAAKQSYFFMAISIIVLWQKLIILLLLYISRLTFSLHYQHWLPLAASIVLHCFTDAS